LRDPSGEQLDSDWQALVGRFLAQTDGLVSLLQVVDVSDQDPSPEQLPLIAWGVGGEIGRSGTGLLGALAPTAPIVSSSSRLQRRLLLLKRRDFGGLVRPDAMAATGKYMNR